MEFPDAAKGFAALGHESRLFALRLLVQAGPEGLPAGEIARRCGLLQNTSSSNLNVLSSAGLVISRREGRSVIYTAGYTQIGELIEFLVQDCCGGDASLCGPPFADLCRPED